jgi:hypothetical protein
MGEFIHVFCLTNLTRSLKLKNLYHLIFGLGLFKMKIVRIFIYLSIALLRYVIVYFNCTQRFTFTEKITRVPSLFYICNLRDEGN